MGIYPFMDGKIEDFDPIFDKLIELSGGTARILYDPDAYAAPFVPVAEALVAKATEAEKQGDTALARELYLRAGAVYRISRFPIIRTQLGKDIWAAQKKAYAKGGAYLTPPNQEISIPFTHANIAAGDLGNTVEAYLRLPEAAPITPEGHPVLLFVCGLDAYRTDNTPRTQAHVDGGFATISFEISGTGDCPGAPADPFSPDRVMSSVLNWVQSNAARYNFNTKKICLRGISTGGYNAMRAAHTHSDRLFAVVAQGGGSHHMFDEQWINNQDNMEYPYALAEALAFKFGYPDVASYAKDSNARSKFSLIEGQGAVCAKANCKLLIINGMEDSIFPIEDSIMVAVRGSNKDLICRGNRPHMGNPGGEDILYQWLKDAIAGKS